MSYFTEQQADQIAKKVIEIINTGNQGDVTLVELFNSGPPFSVCLISANTVQGLYKKIPEYEKNNILKSIQNLVLSKNGPIDWSTDYEAPKELVNAINAAGGNIRVDSHALMPIKTTFKADKTGIIWTEKKVDGEACTITSNQKVISWNESEDNKAKTKVRQVKAQMKTQMETQTSEDNKAKTKVGQVKAQMKTKMETKMETQTIDDYLQTSWILTKQNNR